MAPYKIAFTTGAIFSTAVMLKLYFYPKNPKTNDTNQENPTQSNPIQTVTAEQLKNLPISEFHTPVVSGFLKPHFENDQWSQDLMVTMSGLPKDKKGEEVRLEITPKPTESAVADHPDGPVTGSIRAKNGVVYLVGIQTTKQGEIDVKMPFANLNNDGSITVHQGVNVNGKILRKISVGKEPELISKIWIQFPGATALK